MAAASMFRRAYREAVENRAASCQGRSREAATIGEMPSRTARKSRLHSSKGSLGFATFCRPGLRKRTLSKDKFGNGHQERYFIVGDTRGFRLWTLPEWQEAIIDEHEQNDFTGDFVLGDGGAVLAGSTLIEGNEGIRVWDLSDRKVLYEIRDRPRSRVRAVLNHGEVLLLRGDSSTEGLALVYLV
jgi:hypothetical protein